MFEYSSGCPPFMTSNPSMSRSRTLSLRPGTWKLNGCGAMTRPPCSLILSTVSSTESMAGMVSFRNRPIISPSAVVTSSPTMTSKSSYFDWAYFWAMNAPWVSSWSVMQSTSIPLSRALSTWRSGRTTDSGNLMTPSFWKPEYSV